jgi:hypothetical protein
MGEMGSLAYEDTWGFYVDLFAENSALGSHLINDIKDGLRGRLPDIGRTRSRLDVFDYGMATPQKVFGCDIEDVFVERAVGFTEPWRKHWFGLRFEVIDEYYE